MLRITVLFSVCFFNFPAYGHDFVETNEVVGNSEQWNYQYSRSFDFAKVDWRQIAPGYPTRTNYPKSGNNDSITYSLHALALQTFDTEDDNHISTFFTCRHTKDQWEQVKRNENPGACIPTYQHVPTTEYINKIYRDFARGDNELNNKVNAKISDLKDDLSVELSQVIDTVVKTTLDLKTQEKVKEALSKDEIKEIIRQIVKEELSKDSGQ